MNDEEYRKKIEREILSIIEENLKLKKINSDRAKEIAEYILETLHPHMNIDQIYNVAQHFNDHFPELTPMVIEISNEYEKRMKEIVKDRVDQLIKQNKIEEADDLLKKALNHEVKISE